MPASSTTGQSISTGEWSACVLCCLSWGHNSATHAAIHSSDLTEVKCDSVAKAYGG